MLTVVLYGRSLALSSVGAGLMTHEWLQVVRLDADAPDIAQRLAAVEANVVIFDLASAQPDALAFWKTRPGLLLIGIDMTSDTAIVFTRTSTHVATIGELLQLIRGELPVGSRS